MSTARVRLLAGYSVLVALLAGTAAAIGITQRGSGATAEATSILGERYSYATIGGGPKGLSTSVPPYSADATIFGFYLAIGDIAVGSDADARIVAAIRAHHGLAV